MLHTYFQILFSIAGFVISCTIVSLKWTSEFEANRKIQAEVSVAANFTATCSLCIYALYHCVKTHKHLRFNASYVILVSENSNTEFHFGAMSLLSDWPESAVIIRDLSRASSGSHQFENLTKLKRIAILIFNFKLIISVPLTYTALIMDLYILMRESGFIKFDEIILRLLVAQIVIRKIFIKKNNTHFLKIIDLVIKNMVIKSAVNSMVNRDY